METVLVGIFDAKTKEDKRRLKERENLISVLEKIQIPVMPVKSEWPRDCFVNFDGKVYTRKEHGLYADGGYVLPGRNLTFACTEISQKEDGTSDEPSVRYQKLKNLYGNIQIMPGPVRSLNEFTSPHIDLVLLPIAEFGVLFVDRDYYDAYREDVNSASERNHFKVELIPQDYSSPSWPCNTLVVRDGGEVIAIMNQQPRPHLISKLEKLGIKIVSIPFSRNCRVGGSVHCATNIMPQGANYSGGIESLLF